MGRAQPLLLSFCLVLIGLLAAPAFCYAKEGSIAIIYNQQNNAFSFTAQEMKKTLQSGGHIVKLADIKSLANIKAQNRIVLTVRGAIEADGFLNKGGVSALPSSVPQGYSVRKQ